MGGLAIIVSQPLRLVVSGTEGWLVFVGASGCGKTHIGAAIANRCIERGTPALFDMPIGTLIDGPAMFMLVVVTLVSLDVDNNAQFTAVGVVAEPGLIYSSLQALYLTDTNYDWQGNNRTTTDVYKFAYSNRSAAPVAGSQSRDAANTVPSVGIGVAPARPPL